MTNEEVVRLADTFDLQTHLVRMVIVEIAKKRITRRGVTGNAASSVQRKFEIRRQILNKGQSRFAQEAPSECSRDLRKMHIGFGAARNRIAANRPVVISLEEPSSFLELRPPRRGMTGCGP